MDTDKTDIHFTNYHSHHARQQIMRKLFQILLAAAVLVASRGYSATVSETGALSFYIVSNENVEGGRFIDTPDLPKLGYIAANPDLVITRLAAVHKSIARSGTSTTDKNGKATTTPSPARPAVDILLLPKDVQKIQALTSQNIGKRVLMMLRDKPLIAPTVLSPISTPAVQIVMGEHANPREIEDGLKKLVH